MFYNLLLADETSSCNDVGTMVPILVIIIVMIAFVFILPMINNRRQKKNVEEQRNALSIGDTIETVGGIIGVIREIRESDTGRKELVIETGVPGSTTTITLDIQALYLVLNRTVGSDTSTPAAAQETPDVPQSADAEPFEEAVSDQPAESAPESSDVTAFAEAENSDSSTTEAESKPKSKSKSASSSKKSGTGKSKKSSK